MKPTLDDLFKQARHYADWMLRDCGEMRPTYFLQRGGDIVMLMFGRGGFDDAEKNDFARTGQLASIAFNTAAIVFASESWMRTGSEDDPDFDQTIMPSEAIDRQEAIMLMGETPAGHQTQAHKIVRHGNGKFFNLTPIEDFPGLDSRKGDRVEGRFTSLLPRVPPTAAEQAGAQILLAMKGLKLALKVLKPVKPSGPLKKKKKGT